MQPLLVIVDETFAAGVLAARRAPIRRRRRLLLPLPAQMGRLRRRFRELAYRAGTEGAAAPCARLKIKGVWPPVSLHALPPAQLAIPQDTASSRGASIGHVVERRKQCRIQPSTATGSSPATSSKLSCGPAVTASASSGSMFRPAMSAGPTRRRSEFSSGRSTAAAAFRQSVDLQGAAPSRQDDPNLLHDAITVFDHALTPGAASKRLRYSASEMPSRSQ